MLKLVKATQDMGTNGRGWGRGGGGGGEGGGKGGEGSPKLCAGGKLRPVRDESVTSPYGYFCCAGTSPIGLLGHVAYQYFCVELGMPN